MNGTHVPRPESRELRAAGLAALAEAGVIGLPVHMIVTQSGDSRIGTAAFVVPFAVLYVVSVLLACGFRSSRNVPAAAGIAAIAIGLWFGRGDLSREGFSVVLALLVALRVVALALRDWRIPIHGDFGFGVVGLGVEVILATSSQENWKPLLVVIVPIFFVGMLASRATAVWTEAGTAELEEEVRAGWMRRTFAATALLVGAMVTAVIFGIRGSVFDQIGKWIAPVAAALVSLFALALAQIVRPIFWLADQFHIDPEKFRRFFERLRASAHHVTRSARQPGPASLWQRTLGVLVFALAAWALVRAIRRFRPEVMGRPSLGRAAGTVESWPLPVEATPTSGRSRKRELPPDTVRRWYAEALLLLERRELPKEPSLTPAEYLPEVARAFPTCASSFEALTHAYEDVRYGHRSPARDRLDVLQEHQRALVRILSASQTH